ncbi:MAG: DinB family protein [Candidatus Solibacter sp.]
MDPQLEEYRQQFERIADEARELTSGLTEAQFNWRPAAGQWSIEECLSHLVSVGAAQIEVIDPAITAARAKGLTGKGPFEYPAWERFIVRESEAPVRHAMSSPKRFLPIHGQPITGVLPTFLHVQRQLTHQIERADGLDLRKVKVPTPVTRLLKFSLGGTLAVVAAHERRHMAQARRAFERRESAATPQPR